ncbi:MAG: esterase [Verrucomicrobia bacterium]|nr:esterase [Verrucomicrobiota bacterium]
MTCLHRATARSKRVGAWVAEASSVFRLMAPKAESVRLQAGDIPGVGQGRDLTKGTNGVWDVTLDRIAPGAYRYQFAVDGMTVLDPRNPKTSESTQTAWSLVQVEGSDWMETGAVPHGAVSEVTYWSSTLNRSRRLHVYTPPGYESSSGSYPIFYLLHGAGDSDDSWSTVGRAGFILDQLIAGRKARPMVVVIPHGHTGPMRAGGPRPAVDEFLKEFTEDIMPHVEKRYRVYTDRKHRAMAGLSMGRGHTLNIGIPQLEKFGYLGVFSSGVFGIVPRTGAPAPEGPTFEERHRAKLDDATLKEGLKLFWFATGKDDFLVETSRATVAMLKKHDFKVEYQETEGAHTWIVWREYLRDFAQKLLP